MVLPDFINQLNFDRVVKCADDVPFYYSHSKTVVILSHWMKLNACNIWYSCALCKIEDNQINVLIITAIMTNVILLF